MLYVTNLNRDLGRVLLRSCSRKKAVKSKRCTDIRQLAIAFTVLFKDNVHTCYFCYHSCSRTLLGLPHGSVVYLRGTSLWFYCSFTVPCPQSTPTEHKNPTKCRPFYQNVVALVSQPLAHRRHSGLKINPGIEGEEEHVNRWQ